MEYIPFVAQLMITTYYKVFTLCLDQNKPIEEICVYFPHNMYFSWTFWRPLGVWEWKIILHQNIHIVWFHLLQTFWETLIYLVLLEATDVQWMNVLVDPQLVLDVPLRRRTSLGLFTTPDRSFLSASVSSVLNNWSMWHLIAITTAVPVLHPFWMVKSLGRTVP